MRLWTIHPARVWERLQNEAELRVDSKRLPYGEAPRSYRWLADQLIRRLPGYPGTLPWWAYTEKPDLRSFRFLRPIGKEVRIELELDASEFLVLPSWAWHRVFCLDYLAFSEYEYEGWKRALREAVTDENIFPLPEPWQSDIEKSWERLFDPALPSIQFDRQWPASELVAVFGVMRLRDLRRATFFYGKSQY